MENMIKILFVEFAFCNALFAERSALWQKENAGLIKQTAANIVRMISFRMDMLSVNKIRSNIQKIRLKFN